MLLPQLIEEYTSYLSKHSIYPTEEREHMKIYYELLLENSRGYNTSYISDCRRIVDNARLIVGLSKQDYPDNRIDKIERAKYYNRLVDFAKDERLNGKKSQKMIPLPIVMNDFERKLDYVKNYKDFLKDKVSNKELADRYYVKERTIRSDRLEIMDGKLSAFGQKIDIGYDADKKELFSTPVPLFMVQNITQIVAMLNGLGIMHQDVRFESYAEATAVGIWKQLTDSVRDRIYNDLIDILHLDKEWYTFLYENSSIYELKYYTEHMITSHSGRIMTYLKNGTLVKITYSSDDEICCLQNSMIKDYSNADLTTDSGITIRLENIIDISESGS